MNKKQNRQCVCTHGADYIDDVLRSVHDGADVTTERLVLRMRTGFVIRRLSHLPVIVVLRPVWQSYD